IDVDADELEIVAAADANDVALALLLAPAVDRLSTHTRVSPDELVTEGGESETGSLGNPREKDVLAPEVRSSDRDARRTGSARTDADTGNDHTGDAKHRGD